LTAGPAAPNASQQAGVWSRPYILLCTAVLLCYTSQYLLISTLPLYVLDLGASVVVAGLVLSAFSITSFGMRPIVSFLTDTKGRLNVLMAGAITLSLTGFAFAIPGLAVTFISNTIRGLGWASINTASYTVLLKVVPVHRRGEASSYYSVATSAATSFAPVVALWLVAPPTANYLAVFVLAGLTALVATGVVRLLARTSRDLAEVEASAADLRLNLASIIDRRVLLATLLLFSMTITYPATTSFIPVYAREMGIENSGAFFGVGGVVTIVASLLMGRFFNHGSRALWLVLGFVLCALGVVGLMLATDLWSLTLAGVVGVLGQVVLNPILLAVAIDRADPRRPGSGMATFSLAYQMGNGIGAPIAGLLIEGLGYQGMFLGALVALAAGFIASVANWRSLGNPARSLAAAAGSGS
jgi:MFS family permease